MYKLVNNQDPNIEISLKANEEGEAAYKALELLGWYLIEVENENE